MTFFDPAEYCPMCRAWMGAMGQKRNRATKDHFIPRSLGGSDEDHNTWVICSRCNLLKASRLPTNAETWLFNRQKGFK